MTETPRRIVLSLIQKGEWKAGAGFRTHGLILDTSLFILLSNYVDRHAQQESLNLGCDAGKRSGQDMAMQSLSTERRQAAKAIAVDVIAHSTVCKGKMVGGRSLQNSYNSGGRGRRSNQRGKNNKIGVNGYRYTFAGQKSIILSRHKKCSCFSQCILKSNDIEKIGLASAQE